MTHGYLYCFSNESMPGIFKVGMTERTPDIRLNEANVSDTWKPPTPYKVVIAKRVSFPKKKEIILHKLLSQYTERINPKREFFRISSEEIISFFDLLDGELWINRDKDEYEKYNSNESKGNDESKGNNESKGDDEGKEDDEGNGLSILNDKCRDANKCFKHGQLIRHTIGNNIWIGKYDSSKKGIIHNEELYQGRSPLNNFAKSHYEKERNDRCSSVNAWAECECKIDDKWISTYDLKF